MQPIIVRRGDGHGRRRIRRSLIRLGLAGLFVVAVAATALATHTPRFQLFGNATWDKDPTDTRDPVIAIDTSMAPGFGGVFRTINAKIGTLDDHLSVRYYFTSARSCGGGSPRIQLAIDTDGDGVSNGNAFGYIGPSPAFTLCAQNTWVAEDLTVSVTESPLTTQTLRWDLTQFGGPFYNTWDQVKVFFNVLFPNHMVLTGALVDDTFVGSPAGAGLAFYDDITIGQRTLWGASDAIGN